jgi:hypothetical protein
MNILNYINSKNEKVSKILKKINSDLSTVDSLINLKNSSDINAYLKIENELNQYGGGNISTDIITINQVDGKDNFILDDKKKTVTIEKHALSPFNINVLDDFKLELVGDNFTNYKSYEPNNKIYVLISKDDNKLIEIKILQPLSQYTKINDILPNQLKSDEDLKFKLYKASILLKHKNDNITKFTELIVSVDKISDRIGIVKNKLKNKLANSTTELKTEYSSKLDSHLNDIQKTLNSDNNDHNSMNTQVKDMEKTTKSLEELVV